MLPEKYCFDIEKSAFFIQFDQNQSVVNYFLLFDVHITLGFESDVSTFFLSARVNYIGKTVYIESVDSSSRYLALNNSIGSVRLLPLTSATIRFPVQQSIWQLLQQTYSSLTCVSLESASDGPVKNLRHYIERICMHSIVDVNQNISE
jgi:hypothetical protein